MRPPYRAVSDIHCQSHLTQELISRSALSFQTRTTALSVITPSRMTAETSFKIWGRKRICPWFVNLAGFDKMWRAHSVFDLSSEHGVWSFLRDI